MRGDNMKHNRSTQLGRSPIRRRTIRPAHSHMNIMSLALDPMVVPQLNDSFREPGQTYAQSLKSFIDFVHKSDNDADPLATYCIY